ncbi:Gfo/Idh/MocA family oxidoreductase [Candidatus Woesearchaeota archaeon]|nr:Gfo/Idh/MocA family oxidoreductase [Candidatus Woesearchaeota archaeon]
MGRAVNLGIIGVGRWGKNYLRTFSELDNASVRWLCSRTAQSVEAAVREIKPEFMAKATTNYGDILSDKSVDAVAIASDGSIHHSIAKAALESGKHVIVEKPLALSSKEAEELVTVASRHKRLLMVSDIHRFNPGIQRMREDVKLGMFGKLCYLQMFHSGDGPVRDDMSALWDFFPHSISIAAFLTGQYPLSVSASGASFLKKGVEDVVSMSLKFQDRTFAYAFGSWLYPLKRMEVCVVGETVKAFFDDYAASGKLKYFYGSSCKEPKLNDDRPLAGMLRHFIGCVQNNDIHLSNAKEAVNVVRVLEAAQKSMSKGAAVSLEL